jgi:hypothetical protein
VPRPPHAFSERYRGDTANIIQQN